MKTEPIGDNRLPVTQAFIVIWAFIGNQCCNHL